MIKLEKLTKFKRIRKERKILRRKKKKETESRNFKKSSRTGRWKLGDERAKKEVVPVCPSEK